MIKFVEIFENSSAYDEKIGKCKTSFSLREVFLNPSYIVSMSENTTLKERSTRETLIEGLDDKVTFTDLTVASGGQSASKRYSVIGHPSSFLNKGNIIK